MEATAATVPSVSGLTQARVSISPNTSNGTSTQDKAAKRRARDAERKRLKRAADPELRQREARRAADPERRARKRALQRERRAADPEVRDRDVQRKRMKRAADPELRAREAARKRQRREAALDAARERERAWKAAARAKQHAQPDARFKRGFLDRSFGYSCKNENKGLACCCTHVTSTKASQTKASSGVNTTADAAVETSRSLDVCSQTMPVIKVHRWTEASGVEDSEEWDSCGAACMDGSDGLSCCFAPVTSTRGSQTKASWLFKTTADTAVETSRRMDACSQAVAVVVKVHRWTETNDAEASL